MILVVQIADLAMFVLPEGSLRKHFKRQVSQNMPRVTSGTETLHVQPFNLIDSQVQGKRKISDIALTYLEESMSVRVCGIMPCIYIMKSSQWFRA